MIRLTLLLNISLNRSCDETFLFERTNTYMWLICGHVLSNFSSKTIPTNPVTPVTKILVSRKNSCTGVPISSFGIVRGSLNEYSPKISNGFCGNCGEIIERKISSWVLLFKFLFVEILLNSLANAIFVIQTMLKWIKE